MENEIIKEKEAAKRGAVSGQISFGDASQGFNPIRVSIQQFYGIEINDFACTVAKTALWIAESQMMKKTEDVLHVNLNFLPLKSYVNITEGNALRIDWNDVISGEDLDYIMGNPPFLGSRVMDKTQKQDLLHVLAHWQNPKSLDYVAGWYEKATEMMNSHQRIETALVSTNSITQGEQVYLVWNELLKKKVSIDFAYRTFVWDSESNTKAHVHCVIIGLSLGGRAKKKIYDKDTCLDVKNISPYLLDAENILVKAMPKPIVKNLPECRYGSLINDKGNYVFDKQEMEEFLQKEPMAKQYIRPFIGAYEYINGSTRYILDLKHATPSELRSMPHVLKRVEAVKEFRLNSSAAATVRSADRPTTFFYDSTCEHEFLLIPRTSSERRRYIPIGFMASDIVASDATAVVHDADKYMFGILSSNVHMAWMRTVAGRLKSDYRYAPKTVYNTFPWPSPSKEQRDRIEITAQAVLDARSLYPDSTLADLYDPLTMPSVLRKAHTENDKAVMAAYGFSTKMSEADCVAELMKMYQKLVETQ